MREVVVKGDRELGSKWERGRGLARTEPDRLLFHRTRHRKFSSHFCLLYKTIRRLGS